ACYGLAKARRLPDPDGSSVAIRLRDRYRETPQPLLEGEAESVGRGREARLEYRGRSFQADRRRGPLHLPQGAVHPAPVAIAAGGVHGPRHRAVALAVSSR